MKARSTETANALRGLICPKCGCRHFRVLYTRKGHREAIVRRRECRHCGRRITTWEKAIGCASP